MKYTISNSTMRSHNGRGERYDEQYLLPIFSNWIHAMSLLQGQGQARVDCGVTVGVHGRLRDRGVGTCDDGTYVGHQFTHAGHASVRVPIVSATRPW